MSGLTVFLSASRTIGSRRLQLTVSCAVRAVFRVRCSLSTIPLALWVVRGRPEVLDAEVFCEGSEQLRFKLAVLVGSNYVGNAKTRNPVRR